MNGELELLRSILDGIRIRAWRLQVETSSPIRTSPLRGTWGKALHAIDRDIYGTVFEGWSGGSPEPTPLYLFRVPEEPAPGAPAFDWIRFGDPHPREPRLWEALEEAGRMGLGPRRVPFSIRRREPLGPVPAEEPESGFPLSGARWPLPANAPCCISFPGVLRILQGKRLVDRPSLETLADAALRRILTLAGERSAAGLRAAAPALLAEARRRPQEPWRGRRAAYGRNSGRQGKRVVMVGTRGTLSLPGGIGPLAPLLAAALWTHLGKGTVMGLGRPVVEAAGAAADGIGGDA